MSLFFGQRVHYSSEGNKLARSVRARLECDSTSSASSSRDEFKPSPILPPGNRSSNKPKLWYEDVGPVSLDAFSERYPIYIPLEKARRQLGKFPAVVSPGSSNGYSLTASEEESWLRNYHDENLQRYLARNRPPAQSPKETQESVRQPVRRRKVRRDVKVVLPDPIQYSKEAGKSESSAEVKRSDSRKLVKTKEKTQHKRLQKSLKWRLAQLEKMGRPLPLTEANVNGLQAMKKGTHYVPTSKLLGPKYLPFSSSGMSATRVALEEIADAETSSSATLQDTFTPPKQASTQAEKPEKGMLDWEAYQSLLQQKYAFPKDLIVIGSRQTAQDALAHTLNVVS
jgi:hypothetical protein